MEEEHGKHQHRVECESRQAAFQGELRFRLQLENLCRLRGSVVARNSYQFI